MTRARVLHVITRLEPGGAQRNTLYTCANLDRDRFQAGLAWGPGDALDPNAEALDDVSLHRVSDLVRQVAPAADLNALCQIREAIRSFGPAIVHTHSSKAGILGRLAARLERVPVVIHSIHGFGFTPLQPVLVRGAFYLAERVAARWTDHFIAVSRVNADLGVDLGLFRRDAVRVIRSGIDLDRFRAVAGGRGDARRWRGDREEGPVVAQVGNFKHQKAPLDFIRMAALVADAVPGAHFVMTGDGPLLSAARQLADELGIGSRLSFCGWLDDVTELLAATRVSVLTSIHEGLPRAAVESLAAGVPVVATAVDGVPEVVRHGVNGYLTEVGDVAAMAKWVRAILGRPDLHRRLASDASSDLEDFDIDLMVRQQEDLYSWLLGSSRS